MGLRLGNNLILFYIYKFPFTSVEALILSSFFLEKNEAKKASWLSNRFAFKGVRHDKVLNIARLSPIFEYFII